MVECALCLLKTPEDECFSYINRHGHRFPLKEFGSVCIYVRNVEMLDRVPISSLVNMQEVLAMDTFLAKPWSNGILHYHVKYSLVSS